MRGGGQAGLETSVVSLPRHKHVVNVMNISTTRPASHKDLEGSSVPRPSNPASPPAGQYVTLYVLLWNGTTAAVHLCTIKGAEGCVSTTINFLQNHISSASARDPAKSRRRSLRGRRCRPLPGPVPLSLGPLVPHARTPDCSIVHRFSVSHLSQGQQVR